MNCPKCHGANVVVEGEQAHCLSCENFWKPYFGELSGEFQKQNTVSVTAMALHHRADAFAFGSGWLIAIGLIIGFISILMTFAGSNIWLGFVVAGALFSSGFWLYLIAQVMHIRANTER